MKKLVATAGLLGMVLCFAFPAHAKYWTDTGDLDGAVTVWSLLETTTGEIYAGTGPNGGLFRYVEDKGVGWTDIGPVGDCRIVADLMEDSAGALYAAGVCGDGVTRGCVLPVLPRSWRRRTSSNRPFS